jgi:ABC-type transport system substrate-binding protein
VGVGGSTLERVEDPNDPLADELRTGVAMCTSYVGFNTTLPPFDDARVRRAFALALDRERLVTGLLQGNALLANGILPPGMPGFEPRPDVYPFDPVQARALLTDAGYTATSLPPVAFSTAGYGDVSGLVTAMITMWKENLGVTVTPDLRDPFTYYDELYAGNAGHLYDSGWCADYPDPQNFLDILYYSGSPQNVGGFSDAAIDKRLEAARIEPDAAERVALYQEIETEIIAAAPAIPLSHALDAVLVKPYVRGYKLTPIGVSLWQYVSMER